MMETTAGCTSNVHTWSLTYGFQTLQNLDLVRSVFRICFAHDIPPVMIYLKLTGTYGSFLLSDLVPVFAHKNTNLL